jgi:DNA end-binding protein Ku
MLDLARHIVDQKAGHLEPDRFEDQYETALIEHQPEARRQASCREGTSEWRERGGSDGGSAEEYRWWYAQHEPSKKVAKRSKKTASAQREMPMPIAGKRPAKEAAAKKPFASSRRKSA